MPTLAFTFPGGRIHATPWDRHVNEGEVEWPPSPWRLLRSLIAVGFTRLGWDAVPGEAQELLDRLASVSPSFRLPPATLTHSRHYMPIHKGKAVEPTKVLDAFARVAPDQPMLVHYDVALADGQLDLLRRLVEAMTYLGRAESWCDVSVVGDEPTDRCWCRPDISPASGGDHVSRLAVLAPEAYREWRAAELDVQRERMVAEKGRALTRAQIRSLEKGLPSTITDCLLADTTQLRKQGWSQPPGARHVMYARPADVFPRLPQRARQRGVPTYEAALLALDSDTVRGTLLPLMARALPQAELLHQALVKKLGEDAARSPAISGRGPDGRPLTGHQHAAVLPLDLDEDGRIDHVIVHAPMGLDALAQRAIRQVRRTWSKGIDADIAVTCAGFGDVALFARQLRTRSGQVVAALSTGAVWESVTPFVPVRHMRATRDTLEQQLRAECASHGLPDPVSVELLARDEVIARKLLRFVRRRRDGKPQPPRDCAFGVRLVFASPVTGPIALGYASHYGLGVFAAVR